MSYYNTTHQQGAELTAAVARTNKQEAAIIEIFKQRPGLQATPWEVLSLCILTGHNFLIGSVRRAMTDLCSDNILIKTGERVVSDKGVGSPEHKFMMRVTSVENLKLFK